MNNVSVEIFKTNVRDGETSDKVMKELIALFPHIKVNCDLADCDNVLRIEGNNFSITDICEKLHNLGYQCECID